MKTPQIQLSPVVAVASILLFGAVVTLHHSQFVDAHLLTSASHSELAVAELLQNTVKLKNIHEAVSASFTNLIERSVDILFESAAKHGLEDELLTALFQTSHDNIGPTPELKSFLQENGFFDTLKRVGKSALSKVKTAGRAIKEKAKQMMQSATGKTAIRFAKSALKTVIGTYGKDLYYLLEQRLADAMKKHQPSHLYALMAPVCLKICNKLGLWSGIPIERNADIWKPASMGGERVLAPVDDGTAPDPESVDITDIESDDIDDPAQSDVLDSSLATEVDSSMMPDDAVSPEEFERWNELGALLNGENQ